MGDRRLRRRTVYGLCTFSLLILAGVVIVCVVTDRDPLIHVWQTSPTLLRVVNISEGRVELLSIDGELLPAKAEEHVSATLSLAPL